jgi:hypothetical protein
MIDHGFYERNGLLDPEADKQKKLTDILRRWHLKEIDRSSCRIRLDKAGLTPFEITSFMRMSWSDLGLGVEPVSAREALKAMNESLRNERWARLDSALSLVEDVDQGQQADEPNVVN